MNIYIQPENEWKLRAYLKQTNESMSGLINQLLIEYFAKEKQNDD